MSEFEKLRVFLSWSGGRSMAVAQAMKEWLPSVLQNVKPYFSPDDIEKGSRWSNEIRAELENTDFGLIFLTPENLDSPWILFEAGALSKLEKGRVAPLLLEVEPVDVVGPLAQMQLTKFDRDDYYKLIKAINRALGARGLEDQIIENVFDRWWPDLESKFHSALASEKVKVVSPKRDQREILEEILERLRSLEIRGAFVRSRPVGGLPMILRTARMLNNIKISDLELTERTTMSLVEAGIHDLECLLRKSAIDLIKIPNLGKKSLTEITDILGSLGFSLRNENE